MKLAVYGLGKLGLPFLYVLAKSGFDVEGVDPNYRGQDSNEPGVDFTKIDPPVIGHENPTPADVNFIVVPTPSLSKGDHRGGFDSAFVETALRHIRNVNKPQAFPGEKLHRPVAVIVSTLSPGTCDILVKQFPTLDIVYNPTFIALGNVVKGLTQPDLLLLGGENVRVVENIWTAVFNKYGTRKPFVHYGTYTEVELIKLSVNAALGTKISLANSLGQLFSAWGVDPKAVEVIGKDPRIGPALLTPGGPISGPCLPRDNAALQYAGIQKGVQLPLAVATDRVNHDVLNAFLDRVLYEYPTPKSVGILGMTYKYGTGVTTGAPGLWLQKRLLDRGIEVTAWDPPLYEDNPMAVTQSDVLVCTLPEWRVLIGNHKQVIDLWA